MAVLMAADSYQATSWSELSRTDTVANSLDPAFRKPLHATYTFERLQPMQLVVYDVDVKEKDNRKLKLKDQDFLAQGRFLLSDLLTAAGQTLTLSLTDGAGRVLPGCSAVLSAEELPNTNAVVEMTLSATKLDNKDMFGKSDPFVRISKARETGAWVLVLKTEVINNNLNPTWRPFKASMAQLCNCDPQRPLLLEVFDHDDTGSHDLIGSCQTSLAGLQAAAAAGQGFALVNPKMAAEKPGYTSSGVLFVKGVAVTPRPSFLEYLQGGTELNFIVAIDYTASNGNPRDPNSLHYYSQRPTMYEDAIAAVGRVLECYDSDRMFPAFGFGAGLPPAFSTSHGFALNGNSSNPEVAGVQGILQAYRHTLSSVKLSGPTLFEPIITTAAQIAAQPSTRMKYFVLLILTDGCIMDMANTLRAVVDASNLPLSLLIVGVGSEDFSAMEALDGDKKRIRGPDGRSAARDCVQFCELRPHQRDTVEGLAAKLLAELPGQVVEFFHDMRRMPPPRPGAASMAPPAPAAAAPAEAAPALPTDGVSHQPTAYYATV
ncbi:copine-3-like isoform X1 [Micractinium conductrix]|uniref:Copine-3-like isoform X1 n=1 Tax=Micractinium conductrix TaxID=554055 RepID=A0A2P6VN16_9CHLO|nr:copine-3-like isoform X1 [Micractinium conductrix]|eukprot:PSC75501.1 copine-3-like isoform X1 [Micractinium conductrix]